MFFLNKITADPMQQFVLTGIPEIRIPFSLRFAPTQNRWFMSFSYNGLSANGIALAQSPNLLRTFRNNIPFGIACTSTTGLDPYYVDDFAQQRCNLYLLTAADVAAIEAGVFQ